MFEQSVEELPWDEIAEAATGAAGEEPTGDVHTLSEKQRACQTLE